MCSHGSNQKSQSLDRMTSKLKSWLLKSSSQESFKLNLPTAEHLKHDKIERIKRQKINFRVKRTELKEDKTEPMKESFVTRRLLRQPSELKLINIS